MDKATAPADHVRPFSQLRALADATRPRQMAKNLLIFLAFFFTLGEHAADGFLEELNLFGQVALGFVLFSMITGASYIVNDARDIEADRLHPKKSLRPMASGRLHLSVGLAGAALLAVGGVIGAFFLDTEFGIVAVIYLAVISGYNLYFKDQAILDIFAIASGFVLRAAAGAVVIDVPISPWLYVMTSLGALLISLGKRRSELTTLGEAGVSHRRALRDYTVPFTDQLISVVAPATVIAYTLYTFTADNLPSDNSMMLTIPFVLYGVFRYLFLLHQRDLGGTPEEIFLTDRPLLLSIVLWLVAASAILLIDR